MNLTKLKDSIQTGAAVKFFRTKNPGKKMLLTNLDGQYFYVLGSDMAHFRIDIPAEWESIEDFEIEEFLVAPPAEGWIKKKEIEARGWTAKMIADHLGESEGQIDVTRPGARYSSYANVWALQTVLDAEEQEEVALKVKKTLAAREKKANKEQAQKLADEAYARQQSMIAAESLKSICGKHLGVEVVFNSFHTTQLILVMPKSSSASEIAKMAGFKFQPEMLNRWVIDVTGDNAESIKKAIEDIRGFFAEKAAAKQMLLEFSEQAWPGIFEEFRSVHYALSRDGQYISVAFPYEPDAVDIARSVKGREYNGTKKAWLLPFENLEETRQALTKIRKIFEDKEAKQAAKIREMADRESERRTQRAAQGVSCDTVWSAGRYAPIQEGQIMRKNRLNGTKEIIKVVRVEEPKYTQEPLSFGSPDEDMPWYTRYEYVLATEDEAAPLLAEDARKIERKQAAADLTAIHAEIMKDGETDGDYDHPVELEGSRIDFPFDPQNIYGGGRWFVRTESHIWAVVNNGHDGDFWAINNVRTGGAGAVGKRVPDSAELWDRVQSACEKYQANAEMFLEL